MGNTFGKIFKLSSFGESHGTAIGGIIDGCPAGLKIDFNFINKQLKRRRPGQSKLTTSRNESDNVEFLSGIFNDITTGTPIGFVIKNKDHKPEDYDSLKNTFRPSHADFTYDKKYGIRDYRGGGRSSARETAVRVVAGAIAQLLLTKIGVSIFAYVSQVKNIKLEKSYLDLDLSKIDDNSLRCPDDEKAKEMIILIVGLPVFTHKISNDLNEFDKSNKYIALNTYYSWKDKVLFFLLLPFSRIVISFNGVTAAFFGAGDQFGYSCNYLDAVGILAREFMEKGGRLVGRWSIDGYEFDESIALENDEFLGLALDYDNQDSLSEKRINLWVNMIQSEFK